MIFNDLRYVILLFFDKAFGHSVRMSHDTFHTVFGAIKCPITQLTSQQLHTLLFLLLRDVEEDTLSDFCVVYFCCFTNNDKVEVVIEQLSKQRSKLLFEIGKDEPSNSSQNRHQTKAPLSLLVSLTPAKVDGVQNALLVRTWCKNFANFEMLIFQKTVKEASKRHQNT